MCIVMLNLNSYGNAALFQELFRLRNRIGAEVEDTGGKDGIRFAFRENLCEMLQIARAAAGDYRTPTAHRTVMTAN